MNDPRKGKPSASAVEQMYLCPGSRAAQANVQESNSDEDIKDSGIRIHAALAGDTEALLTLSSEEKTVYEDMTRKANDLVEKHGFDPTKFIAEKRLWFLDAFSGQPDRVYLKDGKALCLDWKAGFLPVTTASENPQLACLAVLVISTHGVAEVTVAIIPRLGAIKEAATYTLDSATSALKLIEAIIANAETPGAPRIAGEKQCRYCSAKLSCVEFKSFTSVVTTVPKTQLPALPASDLAMLIDRLPMVNDLVKAIKAEGKRRIAENDQEFTKLYELTDGRNDRTIINLETVFSRVSELGVKQGDFTKACGLPIGAVDKDGKGAGLKLLIHAATGLKGVALDRKTAEIIDGCVTVEKTAGSLKRKT